MTEANDSRNNLPKRANRPPDSPALAEEGELVRRAQAGDKDSLQKLLAMVSPRIRRFAVRMCKNEADADDVLQDSLLAISKNLQAFEGRASLPTWAFTLARTACTRKRRGKKNASPTATLEDVLLTTPAPEDTSNPEHHAAQSETAAIVSAALNQLADEHREVLLLRDGEGFTASEAAVILGLKTEAVKSRLHRARAALRELLQPILEKGAPPATPRCPDIVRALSDKLEGDLDATTCAAIEEHVAACPSCARTCDALEAALRICRRATHTQMA